MLKYTVVCVMLVAAVAMGWGRLDDVPVNVEAGAHLTWGDGLIWGMFPVYAEGGGNQRTYMLTYTPGSEPDSMWDDSTFPAMSNRRLLHAGLTFQWNVQPVVWGCGWHEDGGNDYSELYWYPVDSAPNVWREDTIDTFELGDGASIAYVPNDYYHPINYVCSGWIYCIPGGNTTGFWRYAVDGEYLPDLAPDGYYPGSGAIIVDQTPHFSWSSSGNQLRLQVSTDQYFTSNVIDEELSSSEFEPTTNLANGTYYWRTATWSAGTWLWCTNSHYFDLQGGWTSLAAIPEAVVEGATIAYDKGILGEGSRSILALPGGNHNQNNYVHSYRYNVTQNSWSQLDSVEDVTEYSGTSLTTSTPTPEAVSPLVMARFTSSGTVPYRYEQDPGWYEWCNESGDTMKNSHFPSAIGSYSSMAIGGDNYMYLLKGSTEAFYYVELPVDQEGGQAAGVAPKGGATAHAITSRGGVAVEYELPTSAHVRVTVHDAVGRQVGHLDAGDQQRGVHRLNWDRDSEGRRLTAGAYFVLLDTGTEQATLKAVVE
jgi:hypothetical protein